MAKRYHTHAGWWEDPPPIVTLTVHEQDRAPVRTGLVDANGIPLYASNTRPPIGFVDFALIRFVPIPKPPRKPKPKGK